jgi:ribosomal protein S6--L-glutamate ligase
LKIVDWLLTEFRFLLDMILSFHPCFDTDVQIILGDRSPDATEYGLIRNAKAIILPQGCRQDLYEACSKTRAPVFPKYEMRFKYPGKMGQSFLFKDFGLLHPETLCWRTVDEFKKANPASREFPHKLPFFIKEDKSHEAEGVFLVKDADSLSRAFEFLDRRESSGFWGFVTQEFIPSQGKVLRAVIIGRQVKTYWKLPGRPGQVITTISRDALIDHHWRPDLQERGRKQVLSLAEKTGIDLAAVDLVFPLSEDDPVPFFLEINYFFGRRGLGGSEVYYRLLYEAIQDWLAQNGLNPESVSLI